MALEGRGWREEGQDGRWRAGQGLARAGRSPPVLGPGWGCGRARAALPKWSDMVPAKQHAVRGVL